MEHLPGHDAWKTSPPPLPAAEECPGCGDRTGDADYALRPAEVFHMQCGAPLAVEVVLDETKGDKEEARRLLRALASWGAAS